MRNAIALFELSQEMLRRSEYEHSVRDVIALTAVLVRLDKCECRQPKKTPQIEQKCPSRAFVESEGGCTD